MDLSRDEKEKIYREEKARAEAKDRLKREAAHQNLKRGGIGCLVIIGIVGALALVGTISSPKRWDKAHDLQQGELGKYRGPDFDDSTQWDSPRPPIVTRWIIWKPERIRAWYVPDAKAGEAPPYRGWKILVFVDEDTKKPIEIAEVVRRFDAARSTRKP